MRWEFQLHAVTANSDKGTSEILIETTFDVLKAACALAEAPDGTVPDWARFFLDHRLVMAPYGPYPAKRSPYSREETLAALEGMREALARDGDAWGKDPRWVRSWGSPLDLAEWLASAADAVKEQPPGTLFEVFVQDD